MEEFGTEEPEHDTGEEVEEEVHWLINLCAGCYKKEEVAVVLLFRHSPQGGFSMLFMCRAG